MPKVVNASQARSSLYGLLDETADRTSPFLLQVNAPTGYWSLKRIGARFRRRCFVLSIPGMRNDRSAVV